MQLVRVIGRQNHEGVFANIDCLLYDVAGIGKFVLDFFLERRCSCVKDDQVSIVPVVFVHASKDGNLSQVQRHEKSIVAQGKYVHRCLNLLPAHLCGGDRGARVVKDVDNVLVLT